MFENTFKKIDEILRRDDGCSTEIDYIEQTSWVLFLKYLDDHENEKYLLNKLKNKNYIKNFEKKFQWSEWAFPKKNGKLDINKALTGNDLILFVNNKLFPYLSRFGSDKDNINSTDYKIGQIFNINKGIRNKIESGYNLRDIINKIENLKFNSKNSKHEMSYLYESKIKNMGNAGRNGGEYYTPRPLIKKIVEIINPKIGNKIYDGSCGSAGFLAEAFEYLKRKKNISTDEINILQKKTLYGKEKKSLPFIIGNMNLILHGIESPNIERTNTLNENVMDYQKKDKVDIILANPPFGGEERTEIQQNFPIKSSETANLFLQHFIKKLNNKGKCGVVIKNTFLSNVDAASVNVRKMLLNDCNLFAILDLPVGVFSGATAKVVVLFFEKGKSTNDIFYYQLQLERNLGKTKPLLESDLKDFSNCLSKRKVNKYSWFLNINEIDKKNYDLTVKNPNIIHDETIKTKDIFKNLNLINKNENHNQSVVSKLFEKYEKTFNDNKKHWKEVKISDVAHVEGGTGFPKKYQGLLNEEIHFYKVSDMNHPENQVLMNISQNTISKKNLKILGGKIFESGSIIFPKIGGAIATNKKRLTTVNCCVDNNVMGIIPNKKKIIPEYLYEIFNSVELKKFANDAGYPSITKPKIENFTFLMPIELNKQKEISTLIRQIKSVLNNLINNNNSKIDLLIDLNKRILN